MDYVREYRRKERELRLQAQCEQGVATREKLLALRGELATPEEIQQLIADAMKHMTANERERPPQRRFHLSDDELHYEPTVDPEIAKQKAREQLRHLAEEEKSQEDGV
jgi:hypothetical protein